jgi:hypothetical protein
VDLVDEQDGVGLGLDRGDDPLEPLLEVPAESGTRQQRAQV